MKITLALVVLGFGLSANAATPAFNNLSQGDVDNIEREMSANTNLHDVLPPSSLGSNFGFEIGIDGGLTNSPAISQLIQQASGTTFDRLPHADVVGAVTLPFAITIEGSYLPKISVSGADYTEYAAALKWTPTDVWTLPVNIAARGFLSHSDFSFQQTVTDPSAGPVNVNVANSNSVSGVQVLVSPKLPIIEPYIGFGLLRGAGTLNVSGNTTSTIFNYTSAQNASSSARSTQLMAGFDLKFLFIFGFGAEYSHAFGTDTYTAKLSLKF